MTRASSAGEPPVFNACRPIHPDSRPRPSPELCVNTHRIDMIVKQVKKRQTVFHGLLPSLVADHETLRTAPRRYFERAVASYADGDEKSLKRVRVCRVRTSFDPRRSSSFVRRSPVQSPPRTDGQRDPCRLPRVTTTKYLYALHRPTRLPTRRHDVLNRASVIQR